MQNNIKKILVIVPMIFLLCMSFIGINVQAEVEVDKQNTTVTTSDQSTESNKSTNTKVDDSKANKSETVLTENKDTGSSGSVSSATGIENLFTWKNVDGKLYYINQDGIVKKTRWFKEKDENPKANNDYEYYLDKNYAATIGWKEINGLWFYFDEAGIKQTGWHLIKYSWYHLDDEGVMDIGWIKEDGKKFYLNDEGIMAIGKKYINNNWYFFGTDGDLQTGFYNNNKKQYYSNKDGIMAANEWITSKSNNKYYVKADSGLATGKTIINDKMEEFNSNGIYIGSTQMEDHLFIKYLSVGDADCAFIKLPNGETALIDTGDVNTSEKVIDFLKKQELKTEDGKGIIDYIIITHGHSDHIGGLASVLDNFKAKKVYMPSDAKMKDWYSDVKVTTESAASIEMMKTDYDVYNDAVKAMKDKNIDFIDTKNGEYIDKNKILQFVQSDKNFGGIGAEKISQYYWGINENSAIVYLNYGDLQALFAADMEWNSERDFWKSDLLNGRDVDVLKVPHHGNDTSSTGYFIEYLKADIGIISRAGESIKKNTAYGNLISGGVSVYETSAKDGLSIYATPENWTVQN